MPAETFSVQGIIYDVFNKPLKDVTVQAFDQDLRSEQLLGKAVVDDKGHYSIRYKLSKFARAEKESADLFIRVSKGTEDDTSPLKEIGKSSIHFNVPPEFTLDFKVDGSAYTGLSEFDRLINVIEPLLERQHLKIADLQENDKFKDFSFLHGETGEPKSRISLLPIAFALSKSTSIAAGFFYGLLRLQFPSELNELLLVKSESLIDGIKQAIVQNIISAELEKKTAEFIDKLNKLSTHFILTERNEENIAFKKMISAPLRNNKMRNKFIDTYFATESEPETFWEKLAEQEEFRDGKALEGIKHTLRINRFTANVPALTALLYKEQSEDSESLEMRYFSKFTHADWTNRIEELVASGELKEFPDGIEGETPEEKTKNYADALDEVVNNLFPTDVFINRLSKDNSEIFAESRDDLSTFLNKNPRFDLNTTRIDTLFNESDFDGIDNQENLKKR